MILKKQTTYQRELKNFYRQSKKVLDWIGNYYSKIDSLPVKPDINPGKIKSLLPPSPPEKPEKFEQIFADFKKIIFPGITHWQSPNFFGYFPANSSFYSLLGEFLTAALGVQAMKWETSPAAAELEEVVLNWLRQMLGIPESFHGVIQDTASTATLVALLVAREKLSAFKVNQQGLSNQKFRVYCSEQAHSSIEKDVRIIGIGSENLIKIPVDQNFSMQTNILKKVIEDDLASGYTPLAVVAALGTTGSTAIDDLEAITALKKISPFWLHVDAAYAGSALILPEYRHFLKGIEFCDSFVVNPHKWLFTNFDISAFYIQERNALLKTFSIHPDYLRTDDFGLVNDYCDWGIQLGRRFRALKLWFVLRGFGLRGLQEKMRNHIRLAQKMEEMLIKNGNFEIIAPRNLNLICFRFRGKKSLSEESLNALNKQILERINKRGKIFLSHTVLNGKYTLRMVCANTNLFPEHVETAFSEIVKVSRKTAGNFN